MLKKKKIAKELGYLKAVSDKYGFDIIESDADYIDGICLGSSHGGLVAICEERSIPCYSSISDLADKTFLAMIQGIEDPYNFGYSLRSLYACGCDGIVLGERNWMSAAGVVCRSSAGASEMFDIYKGEDEECIEFFKSRGFNIICAHEDTDNLLGECEIPFPALLVVGGEKRGISKAILDKADLLIKIPYGREFKASLSAASATTMFAYEIMRQKRIK